MVMLCKLYCLIIEQCSIGHLNRYLQTILMSKSLLCLENIERLCQQRLISDIFLFSLSCNGCRILRNHLRTMDNVDYEFIHFFTSLSGIYIPLKSNDKTNFLVTSSKYSSWVLAPQLSSPPTPICMSATRTTVAYTGGSS